MLSYTKSRFPQDGAALRRQVEVIVDDGCGDLCAGIEKALESHGLLRLDVSQLVNQRDRAMLATVSVLILGPRTADGTSSIRLIEWIRSNNPRTAIYICTAPSESAYRLLRQFSIAGADDLVTLAVTSDFRDLAATVRARTLAPPPECELDLVAAELPAGAKRTLALHCLRNGHRRGLERDVARSFGMTIQTVNHQLHTIGLPTTGVLMRCGRQYHAFELERRGIRSREEIARRLDMASAGALRMQRARVRRTLARDGARGAVLLSLLDSGSAPAKSFERAIAGD
jgi:hypothetical protein